MRVNDRENYGFGTRLPTKPDRIAIAAVVLMLTVLGSMIGVLLWK